MNDRSLYLMHSFLASEENVGYELYDRIWELQQWHVQEGSEIPGDHVSGTPGNVRKLWGKCWQVSVENLVRENCLLLA